jgi:hypothetical protein
MAATKRSHPYAARPVAATHTWLTPPEIVAALGPFDLDPCAAPSPRPWPTAARHIELPECGLTAEWSGRVWCNPPFGDEKWPWIERMALHGNGIALLLACTETVGFHRWVWPHATAVLFLKTRPHFHHPDGRRAEGNSGGPVCLIAYGEANAMALMHCGLRGAVLRVASLTAKEPTDERR